MREIVLDTETTGLDPRSGDRLVEIGCVELENHIPSGETWHQYMNPERDMPTAAFEVHGLSEEFLSDKPLVADLADQFLEFIGEATLVIHNATFITVEGIVSDQHNRGSCAGGRRRRCRCCAGRARGCR